MGAWGYKALESDEGLDVVDFLGENIPENFIFELSGIITLMRNNDFLGKDVKDIDFYCDNSAIAITELYFIFQEKGKLDFPIGDDEETLAVIKSFTADKKSLEYLLEHLTDIKKEVPVGEREIVELWQDSKVWEEWKNNLDELIIKLENELGKFSGEL